MAAEGINVRLVSFPSWELFSAQGLGYQQTVLLPGVKARLAVEAGVRLGWERWVGSEGEVVSVERYGASAPAKVVFQEYGFTVENIVNKAYKLLGREP
jgi:transketolase